MTEAGPEPYTLLSSYELYNCRIDQRTLRLVQCLQRHIGGATQTVHQQASQSGFENRLHILWILMGTANGLSGAKALIHPGRNHRDGGSPVPGWNLGWQASHSPMHVFPQ